MRVAKLEWCSPYFGSEEQKETEHHNGKSTRFYKVLVLSREQTDSHSDRDSLCMLILVHFLCRDIMVAGTFWVPIDWIIGVTVYHNHLRWLPLLLQFNMNTAVVLRFVGFFLIIIIIIIRVGYSFIAIRFMLFDSSSEWFSIWNLWGSGQKMSYAYFKKEEKQKQN